jgi:hypothetical protein
VTVSGIPSNGSFVVVGNGQIGQQPTAAASVLPASVLSSGTTSSSNQSSSKENGAKAAYSIAGSGLGLIVAVVTLAVWW